MLSHHKVFLFLFLSISTFCHTIQENPERNPQLLCHDKRRINITDQIATPSMIVLNSSLRPTIETSYNTFRNDHKLSFHYIINTDGKLYKGISEQLEEIEMINGTYIIDQEYLKLRAWHTGVGYWHGDKQEINNINTHSIGILFVNKGTDDNTCPNSVLNDPTNTTHWFDFTSEQQQSFVNLAQQLKSIYNIANKDIVGYHEVRTDTNDALTIGVGPGPLFPWKKTADQGVGLYHNLTEEELSNPCQTSIEDLQKSLHAWGYSVKINGQRDTQTNQAIKQLQIHHDPLYYHAQDQQNICRTSHIINNLLAQHYAQQKSSSGNDKA